MSRKVPIIEEGVIAGNYYDKYNTANPIARLLMQRFVDSVSRLVDMTNATKIHEVGCGEGHLSGLLATKNRTVTASDFSDQIINRAKEVVGEAGLNINFQVASIYDLAPERDAAELVVCCEVLEHLDDPVRALKVLANLANPYLLVSVPREPIWRILNIARGKYITSFGNTPGHVQHWSKKSFLDFLRRDVSIVKVLSPFPWTIALCRRRT